MVRTPLTSIMGNADNLLTCGENMDSDTRRQLCADIYTDAQWLTGMVENLLSASRMEDGSLKLTMNIELMDDMIAEAVRHMGRRLEGFTLDIQKSDSLLFVQAGARLIVQVIINLLDNAINLQLGFFFVYGVFHRPNIALYVCGSAIYSLHLVLRQFPQGRFGQVTSHEKGKCQLAGQNLLSQPISDEQKM